jgi:hypothetical protein
MAAISQDPTTAAGPSPERRLEVFIRVFLAPVATDGSIDSVEESPLLIAYRALGVDGIHPALPFGSIEDACGRAAIEARRDPGGGATPEEVREAYGIMRSGLQRITAADWLSLRGWLKRQYPDHESVRFSELSLHAIPQEVIASFYRLVGHVRQVLGARDEEVGEVTSVPATAGVVVEPRGESPGPVTEPPVEAGAGMAPIVVSEMPPAGDGEPDPLVLEFDAPRDACERVMSGEVQRSLRQNAGSIADRVLQRLDRPWRPWLLFDRHRRGPAEKAPLVREDPEHLWILGDLHGDLLALECAIAHVREQDPQHRFLLLGDLIDRGELAYEVVLRVLQMVLEQPERIAWLAGNHDEALSRDHESGLFTSDVSPSDFKRSSSWYRHCLARSSSATGSSPRTPASRRPTCGRGVDSAGGKTSRRACASRTLFGPAPWGIHG